MAADAQSLHAESPAMLLTEMNRALCGNTQDQFVTAAYTHLDAEAGVLRYAAAGHPAMLRVRYGRVEEITENGFPLGIVKEMAYEGISLPLAARDRMILYTDGLVEARNASGQMFSDENLHRAAAETAELGAEEAADRILGAVTSWSQAQEDDLTVIVCDFLGARGGSEGE
jgi:sigma-B regulation protein RsbU (phosphoserine phosphatase)